jgi:hypothetical protein
LWREEGCEDFRVDGANPSPDGGLYKSLLDDVIPCAPQHEVVRRRHGTRLHRAWVPDLRSGILILRNPSTSSFDKLRMRWRGVSKDMPHRVRDDGIEFRKALPMRAGNKLTPLSA